MTPIAFILLPHAKPIFTGNYFHLIFTLIGKSTKAMSIAASVSCLFLASLPGLMAQF
jgi:hypothetical protein